MDALLKHLLPSRVDESDLRDDIIPHLLDRGFKRVGDLEDLEISDLKGFNPLIQRRIMKLVHGDKFFSLHGQNEQNEHDVFDSIYIRYILCNERLFTSNVDPVDIRDINPGKMTLSNVIQHIRDENKIPPEEEIELYSHEGYPMQNNVTNEASLLTWEVADGDLLYAMIRLKKQPGIKKFATLPELDHDVGTETFTIETQFHGAFTINAYMDCDSPEDIAQKVYSITNIPVPFIALYVRRGYTYERLSAFTELNDGDHIRVLLRDPHELIRPRSIHYGPHDYTPIVQQSDNGIVKFYSILKFLCSTEPYNKEYDYEKLLSYLMKFSNFPPLVYAFKMLKEHSFLSIAGWTALIEGCYFLFKAILSSFANVKDDKVFEFSDYIWSIFIKNSHIIDDVSNIQSELCSLVCPLSGVKLCHPVIIEGHSDLGTFDKENIMWKIENGEDFSEFGLKEKISSHRVKNEINMKRMLMYNPLDTDREVCVWLNPPKITIQMSCQILQMTFSWFDMLNSLHELCVVNPQGLFSGAESLTYNNKGQIVYFMGSAKGTDEHRRIYNPLSNNKEYLELISKLDLEITGGNPKFEKMIFPDISSVLIDPHQHLNEISQSSSIKTSAIVHPQDSINWDTEEAIVVLLDTSASMRKNVFSDMGRLTRNDAAKELFAAFAIRTQAYKLHHAIGLTFFDCNVTEKLGISKNIEKFEESLAIHSLGGSTHLTDAVINGVNQLRYHHCRKRILCLTDGQNNSSTPYTEALAMARRYSVMVDTVLLTWPSGNAEQKALCHATGGICVLPRSMQEALRYFELDAMLSVKERSQPLVPQMDITFFYNEYSYPYETYRSFKSTYIQTFETLTTCSTKSYLDYHKCSTQNSSQQRRIMKELMKFIHNPHKDISVYPSEQHYNKWKVLLSAPDGTNYEGGNFVLCVEFPDKYPLVPPEIRFMTHIYHCNVSSSSGRICHAILGDSYTPSTSMRDILCCIYGLLMCPDMDTPLDGALADEYGYQRNRESDLNKQLDADAYFDAAEDYFISARDNVELYANRPKDILVKELSGVTGMAVNFTSQLKFFGVK